MSSSHWFSPEKRRKCNDLPVRNGPMRRSQRTTPAVYRKEDGQEIPGPIKSKKNVRSK
jgi:hypothetical protein